ncbi:MAG: hypothetical protein E7395_01085 [Ruminococcaceae bacterium]|nr:hypothetical protein [Oscillospiraceae bacterium]
MKKKCLSLITAIVFILVTVMTPFGSVLASQTGGDSAVQENNFDPNKEYKIWFDEPAPDDDKGSTLNNDTYNNDSSIVGWDHYALRLANGNLGAVVFGLTEYERIQLSEKSLHTTLGLNNFSETYLDFGHPWAEVSNYYRDLNLNTAVSTVRYTHDNVDYTREFLVSYPDNVMAIKLTASQSGKLSFTLRPTIPHITDEAGLHKAGKVVADTEKITLSGTMNDYGIQYEGQYKIVPTGGHITYANDKNGENGTMTVTGADSAVIYITWGTNYKTGEAQVFSESGANKLAGFEHPHEKLTSVMSAAVAKGYDEIKKDHIADHSALFSSNKLDLGGEVPSVPTDELIANYKAGTPSKYLEEMYYQMGRYLLIASSREGTLPFHLGGAWCRVKVPGCLCGYWHNINIQMSYWHAFNTNLEETFPSFVDLFNSYISTVEADTSKRIQASAPRNYDANGNNGWNTGTGFSPYYAYAGKHPAIDGNATGALLAELIWDYWLYTQDEEILRDWVYPAVYGNANFATRIVEKQADGTYLTEVSGSPENHIDFTPKGTAFDQSLLYDSMAHTLQGAEILGIDTSNDAVIKRINERIDHLDPIIIGDSGQIKEFREESTYGEFGEKAHRHVSQLLGSYPGTLINSSTPHWLDAVAKTLELRGDITKNWAMANRMALWARQKDGNHAYTLIQHLLKRTTVPNLLSNYDPGLELDANAGSTAGYAEMLLQSHEGYVEVLPALPDAWAKGSFEGLVARGAFEVDASWSDMKADQIKVLSRKGKELKLRYPGVASAKVADASGNAVTFTKIDDDTISFATTQGAEYTISSIPAVNKVNPASDFSANVVDGKVKLTWSSSSNASSYNVYKAEGNVPDYTFVANTKDLSYGFNEIEDYTERVTYAVTAVDANGKESKRAWDQINKIDPVQSASGVWADNTTLEIYLETSDAVEVESYLIYEKASDGTLSLIKETPYSVMVLENASKEKTYAVKARYNGVLSNTAIEVNGGRPNIMLENTLSVTPSHSPYYSSTVALLNDGDTESAAVYKTQQGTADEKFTVTVAFDGTYKFGKLRVFERFIKYVCSESVKIEVGQTTNGETSWTSAITSQSLKAGATAGQLVATDFALSDIVGDSLRITFNPRTDGNYPGENNYQIGEIEVYAEKIVDIGDKVNAFLNKPIAEVETSHTPISGLPLSHAVDGNSDTRMAMKDQAGPLTVEIDLEGTYILDTLKIEEYFQSATRSDETTIQISNDGGTSWQTVVNKQSLTNTADTSKTAYAATEFSMGDVSAQKVRITFNNTSGNNTATIWEISCSATPVVDESKTTSKLNMQKALENASLVISDANANANRKARLASLCESLEPLFCTKDMTTKEMYDAASFVQSINAVLLADDSAFSDSWGSGFEFGIYDDVISANTQSGEASIENNPDSSVGGKAFKAEIAAGGTLNADTTGMTASNEGKWIFETDVYVPSDFPESARICFTPYFEQGETSWATYIGGSDPSITAPVLTAFPRDKWLTVRYTFDYETTANRCHINVGIIEDGKLTTISQMQKTTATAGLAKMRISAAGVPEGTVFWLDNMKYYQENKAESALDDIIHYNADFRAYGVQYNVTAGAFAALEHTYDGTAGKGSVKTVADPADSNKKALEVSNLGETGTNYSSKLYTRTGFDNKKSGVQIAEAELYIPSASFDATTANRLLIATRTSSSYAGVQLYLDTTQSTNNESSGISMQTKTFPRDEWFKIRFVTDYNLNTAEIQLVEDGAVKTIGSGALPSALQTNGLWSLMFFGMGGAKTYYIGDICYYQQGLVASGTGIYEDFSAASIANGNYTGKNVSVTISNIGYHKNSPDLGNPAPSGWFVVSGSGRYNKANASQVKITTTDVSPRNGIVVGSIDLYMDGTRNADELISIYAESYDNSSKTKVQFGDAIRIKSQKIWYGSKDMPANAAVHENKAWMTLRITYNHNINYYSYEMIKSDGSVVVLGSGFATKEQIASLGNYGICGITALYERDANAGDTSNALRYDNVKFGNVVIKGLSYNASSGTASLKYSSNVDTTINAKLICAQYGADGSLLAVDTAEPVFYTNSTQADVSFTKADNASKTKLMLWTAGDEVIPLTSAE